MSNLLNPLLPWSQPSIYLLLLYIYLYIIYIFIHYYTRVECLSTPCHLQGNKPLSTYGYERHHSTTQPTQPNDFIG